MCSVISLLVLSSTSTKTCSPLSVKNKSGRSWRSRSPFPAHHTQFHGAYKERTLKARSQKDACSPLPRGSECRGAAPSRPRQATAPQAALAGGPARRHLPR